MGRFYPYGRRWVMIGSSLEASALEESGMRPPRSLLVLLLPFALVSLALNCRGFQSIAIDEPEQTLLDEAVEVAARVGRNFVVASVEVRVNGVDLIAALALTPPFFDAGGAVMIGPDLVSISDFSFEAAPDPMRIDLIVAGLSPGPHEVEIEGQKSGTGAFVADVVSFETVGSFAQAANVIPAAARSGPETSGFEGELFGATIGDPLAAAPVGISGGGELRSGFVEAAEASIAGGTP